MIIHKQGSQRKGLFMMKKFAAILCAAAMALSLTACGGGNDKDVSIDTAKLSGELLETVTSDQLSETASDMLSSIYFFEDGTIETGTAYASSGATACEVAVVQSKDAKNTAEVEKLFRTRVSNQSELYASYNEAEVARLEEAIVKSAGAYTVLCVTDDTDKANDILKEYGF